MNETWPEIKKRKMRERRGEVFDWIESLVVPLLECVLILTFIARGITVSGSSMLDTLQDKDRIVISNLFYTPKQGDVVVVLKDSYNSDPIIKRVIATEGQTVNIDFEAGIVYVDGEALDSYLADVDTDANYEADTEVISDGYFHESEYRSAPYFDLRIDGITLLDEKF